MKPDGTRERGSITELAGRVAIVTGAASGIGAEIARALAEAGARVVVADVDRRGAETVARRLPSASSYRADVADSADCLRLVQEVIARSGRVDILVNNAGLQHVSPVTEFPVDQWERLVRVMLFGAFYLIRQVLPVMYAQGWGRIINIGSIHSIVASPNKSAYVAAKHGLLGLTRAVALEAAERGVTVNAVCPAYVRTPLVERQIADLASTENLTESEVVDRIMLAPAAIRRLIEPAEVAATVRFLCSDAASMITGTAQIIDGGWTAR